MTLIVRATRLQASTNEGPNTMANVAQIKSNGTRSRILVWSGLAGLLALPLIAMQFTDDVAWTGFNFLVMGVLLSIVGGCFELALRMSGNWTYRIAFAVAVVTGFLIVWVNLAVGMIGGEDKPANLVFFGVLLVAAVGAVLARFRADGMARAIGATGIAQAAAAGYAAILGETRDAMFVAGYCLLWLASAGLFLLAVKHQAEGSRSVAKAR